MGDFLALALVAFAVWRVAVAIDRLREAIEIIRTVDSEMDAIDDVTVEYRNPETDKFFKGGLR